MITFDKAIEVILLHEGGYSFDALDPGGETNFGISKRSYPNLNIKALTKQQAIEIYRRDYWNKYRLESYPDSIRLQMFDVTVNSGFKNAVIVLQRSLNRLGMRLVVDGAMGPKTRTALDHSETSVTDVILLPQYVFIERLYFYNNIVINKSSQVKFLRGWINRANDVYTRELKWN